MKKIDIFSINLSGIKMIEASAGTGKTFTIILLYLRFLLGINIKKKYSIKNILIITYTKNAVKEIKKRLEKNIYKMYLDCLKKKTNNKNYIKIFNKIKNFKKATYKLKSAYENINDISIYTIHGFCQYILKKKNNYYEYLIDKKKVYEENFLYKESTYNFWRNFFYPCNKEISNIILQYWKSPEDLFKKIYSWLNIKSKIHIYTKIKDQNIFSAHKKNIEIIQKFKKKWNKINIYLEKIFLEKKLNKRIYHKKNFFRWIKKVQEWTKEKTKNYNIPKELYYFSKKKIEKNTTSTEGFPYLKKVNKFLKKKISLKEVLLINAIKEIPKIYKKIKKKKFSYDNLITSLLQSLKKEKNLKKYIQKKFPIAFIDEFQDTDFQQYKLFQKIYIKKKTTLILIGDPKQSIYNFRGADIFFYLKNKSKMQNIYTLNENWRSSKKLIDSVNLLFTRIKNIFLFKKIRFIPVVPSKKSNKKKFFIKKKEQSALKIWLQPGIQKTPDEYNNWISKTCAQNINNLIQKIKKSQAILKIEKKKRKLKIEDICILVKNYHEFKQIKRELLKLNINSYYTSYNKSIFQTVEVKEMYFILKSILYTSNESYFYRALFTSIIYKNTYIISQIKKKYSLWSTLKEKFLRYKNIWINKGILNLIKIIISESNLYQRYFFYKKYKEKISNLIHLGEILEKKTILRKEEYSLITWFKEKVYQKENYNKNYQQKLNHDNKSTINITTIYKSKGLEYPVVWVPFISNFFKSKKFIFHDRKKYNTFINLCESKKKIKLEKEEKLSEEIRLLYVAITRSIFQCNLGVSPLVKKKPKNNKTEFHKSGLGYILQKGKPMTSQELYNEIKKITFKKKIKLIIKKEKLNKKIEKKIFYKKDLKSEIFYKKFQENENTSYTKILKEHYKLNTQKKKIKKSTKKIKKEELNQYTFPQGKKYGKILHKILEKINFKKEINEKSIQKIIKKKIDKKWITTIKNWIQSILIHPFLKNKVNLLSLKKKIIREMEFYLPLKKKINLFSINSIIKKNKTLYFKKQENQKGILKGFIDLIFLFKNKYYFVDYKFNFLGNKKKYYTKKKIKKYFFEKKYNIQFYLYSIALHRFLKKKIKNYNFKKNFGGAYYLFLRGINKKKINQGIFYIIPKYNLVKKINDFFFEKQKNIKVK
jgi:exodeoxyribonuclease V beta subunit